MDLVRSFGRVSDWSKHLDAKVAAGNASAEERTAAALLSEASRDIYSAICGQIREYRLATIPREDRFERLASLLDDSLPHSSPRAERRLRFLSAARSIRAELHELAGRQERSGQIPAETLIRESLLGEWRFLRLISCAALHWLHLPASAPAKRVFSGIEARLDEPISWRT